jgi:ubiquinone/menaquinone biosynthesis C-methylase UbiE
MRVFGFERSLARLIGRLDLDYPPNASILDAACGTGVIGLMLMKGRPRASLVATDINPDLLERTRHGAAELGIAAARVTTAISDITTPRVTTGVAGSSHPTKLGLFDIVATGAAIGYSRDQQRTIDELLAMVKPGGYFLNVEMNETAFGKGVSWRYHYSMMPLSQMEALIRGRGFEVRRIPIREFPARLTRACYVARRD